MSQTTREVIDRQRHVGGCAIVCGSVAFATAVTAAVGLIDNVTGWPVPRQAAVIAALVNAELAAGGSAIGGLSSEDDIAARVGMSIMAGVGGLALYGVATACLACAGII